MRLNIIQLFIFVFFPLSLSAEEHWSCESPADDPSNFLEVVVDNGKIVSFDYSSSTPSPDGDTHFMCTFSAKQNDKDSTWKEKNGKTIVKFAFATEEKDRAVISQNGDTISFSFQMSPTNCGHSTPFASAISISKNKKECQNVEYE